ncbi:MAG: hypothetical protein QM730_29055 [Anaerolineales bacterium]
MSRKFEVHTGFEKYIPLLILFGTITTILNYTGYGVSNHIEQLPIILRTMDRSYLVNDFFTNAATTSIARLYYAKLIVLLAGSDSNLPLVFFMLTLYANSVVSIFTFLFAYDIFDRSPIAGLFASALTMSVSTFRLGWYSLVYFRTLIPTTLAIPIVMAAIWLSFRGKLWAGMLLCGLASLIHPLFGLEMGVLVLAAFGTPYFFNKQITIKDGIKAILPSLLILIPFAVLSLLPQFSQPQIDSSEFVYILAFFRNPARYVPSSFGLRQYIYTAGFLIAMVGSFLRWQKNRDRARVLPLAALVGTILLLCIGGYIFVELFPMRIWTIAQAFRLLCIVQWIGLIFIGGMIADTTLARSTRFLYLTSALHPLLLGAAVTFDSLWNWLRKKQKSFNNLFGVEPTFILLFLAAISIWFLAPRMTILLLAFYATLIVARTVAPRKLFNSIFLAGMLPAVVLLNYRASSPIVSQLSLIRSIEQNISPAIKSELGTQGNDVAMFARQNTPTDSIFLTPPDWGQFRLLARRAIVVDFKAFPFADVAMQGWHQRIIDCYGTPIHTGWAMLPELVDRYKNIDDTSLLILQKKYNISYVVLYDQTSTSYPVIFENSTYKIVHLSNK